MSDLAKTQRQASAPASWSTPSVDVFANDTELLVRADLPGVQSSDVHVSFHEGTLSLEAVRRPSDGGEGDVAHTFRRKFRVTERLDDSAIRAELEDGVLAVHLPKAPEAKPRSIPVSAG